MANNHSIARALLRRPRLLRLLRPAKRLALRFQAIRDLSLRPSPTLSRFQGAVQRDGSWEDYLKAIRTRNKPSFFFSMSDLEEIDNSLRQMDKSWQDQLIESADKICASKIGVLGFGTITLGDNIDWHCDPTTRGRWDPHKYYKLIRLEPRPDGSDARVVWELNRLHFLVTLGQAYRLTKDVKYIRRVITVLEAWLRSNPYLRGINWTSAMEVAIRSINMIWTLCLIRDSEEFPDSCLEQLLHSLYLHGQYIADHIEHIAEWTTNHTIANYTGLLFLGILFPEWKSSEPWKDTGLAGLQREILHQVNHEGVHYESSTYYHGFVAEMSVAGLTLARRNGLSFSDPVVKRIRAMVSFTEQIMCADGRIPLIGDSDDGRLVPLEAFLNKPPADQRWLLSLGAAAFGDVELVQYSNLTIEGIWYSCSRRREEKCSRRREEADGFRKEVPSSASKSICFEDSGYAILRGTGLYLFICAEKHGTQGLGNHQHNDWLSFELSYNGIPFLVDPGTYMYNRDPLERNRCRETAAHNTLRIDGKDIVDIPEQSFALFGDAHAKIVRSTLSDECDYIEAEHRGYERLSPPVIHRRCFYLDKEEGFCLVEDLIEGTGVHDLEWFFQFAPGVDVKIDGLSIIAEAGGEGGRVALAPVGIEGSDLKMRDSWVSQAYGQRQPAVRMRYCMARAQLPRQVSFVLMPADSGVEGSEDHVRSLVDLYRKKTSRE